jgi:hypothetical protein
LGLQWGDGATSADIKDAYRKKSREVHPDVNKVDTPEQALKKFQALQKAYETLMKVTTGQVPGDGIPEEWKFAVWRQGDRIASDRNDVAGVSRKRPAKPAFSDKNWGVGGQLGHPDGRGVVHTRAEYIGDGDKLRPSSVGRGSSKWVTKKTDFKSWNPEDSKGKRASDFQNKPDID